MTGERILVVGPETHDRWVEAVRVFRGVEPTDPSGFLADDRIIARLAVGVDGETRGWVWGHVHRHAAGHWQAQLYDIGVAAGHRRRGTGRRLLDAFRDEARRRGVHRMWLFTDEDNHAAKALYQASGGVPSPHDDATYWWQIGSVSETSW